MYLRGGEAVTRQPHKLKIGSSNLPLATNSILTNVRTMTSISKTSLDTMHRGLALDATGSCVFIGLAKPTQTRMNPEQSVWNYEGVVAK